jgi:hypothetical protein
MGGAGGIVLDSGGTAPGGTLYPFRWLDTSAEPSAATTAVPPPGIRRCNKTSARSKGESDGHSPCAGNAATAARRGGIETRAEMKQAERGPREVVLPKVKPRFEAWYFVPRRLFSGGSGPTIATYFPPL